MQAIEKLCHNNLLWCRREADNTDPVPHHLHDALLLKGAAVVMVEPYITMLEVEGGGGWQMQSMQP